MNMSQPGMQMIQSHQAQQGGPGGYGQSGGGGMQMQQQQRFRPQQQAQTGRYMNSHTQDVSLGQVRRPPMTGNRPMMGVSVLRGPVGGDCPACLQPACHLRDWRTGSWCHEKI